MPREIQIKPTKTYSTHANAVKAVEKKFGHRDDLSGLKYAIMCDEQGRFFPLFIGMDAVQSMIHFHFNVVG